MNDSQQRVVQAFFALARPDLRSRLFYSDRGRNKPLYSRYQLN